MQHNYELFYSYSQKCGRATKITEHHSEGVETEKLKNPHDFQSKQASKTVTVTMLYGNLAQIHILKSIVTNASGGKW